MINFCGDIYGFLDVRADGEVHELMICVIALFKFVEDGVADGVRSVGDAVFHEDGGTVVDERGWHIALWNRVWVDLVFYTNVENGVLLVRKPLAT